MVISLLYVTSVSDGRHVVPQTPRLSRSGVTGERFLSVVVSGEESLVFGCIWLHMGLVMSCSLGFYSQNSSRRIGVDQNIRIRTIRRFGVTV